MAYFFFIVTGTIHLMMATIKEIFLLRLFFFWFLCVNSDTLNTEYNRIARKKIPSTIFLSTFNVWIEIIQRQRRYQMYNTKLKEYFPFYIHQCHYTIQKRSCSFVRLLSLFPFGMELREWKKWCNKKSYRKWKSGENYTVTSIYHYYLLE